MLAFIHDLLIVLTSGLVAGVVCKRLGFSMLVGYLLAGAVIGRGGLGLIAEDPHEIEQLAHAGALLLLFAIGIEFSLDELVRLSRHFLIGGSLQMLLVSAPVALACRLFGVPWPVALLIGTATALSSTVIVFRTLTEWGETATHRGRRAIGILLFQDVALVPLMLLVPLLAGRQQDAEFWAFLRLALNSVLFVGIVLLLRAVFARWAVPVLGNLRSVELVVLFGLIVLVGFCLGAHVAGLPPALGALAAGLALSGNRLTGQIDALILPYRESFGVVFFVSLGTLLDLSVLPAAPWLMLAALAAVLAVKALAAAIALRATGLRWASAAGMGLGLAQLGELSFILLSEGMHVGLLDSITYNRMLLIAIGTLILTPPLLRIGLGRAPSEKTAIDGRARPDRRLSRPRSAIVVGVGPIGRQAGSQLETMGVDVCLVDLSPVNLYPYAQQGFRTIAGDARQADVLDRAGAADCRLAVVAVPDDQAAGSIVRAVRATNPTCTIIVRCRYQAGTAPLEKAGASFVISEEAQVATAVLELLKTMNGD